VAIDVALKEIAMQRPKPVLHADRSAPATGEAVEGATLDEAAHALLIDVRRAAAFDKASTMVAGARWCDPATVADWVGTLPADREIVVYCVHGHEVSQAAALRLRAAGLNARYLLGGFEAWQEAGRPVMAKPDAAPSPS